MNLTKVFAHFFQSEKSSGLILLLCTFISLGLANSPFAPDYLHLWHRDVFSRPAEFWINDGLMTIFFLLVGLEIKRELKVGELADIKRSMLPVLCAIGGMLAPAAIHFAFNHGTFTQNGYGIPMATDIAFSLAILSLLGAKVPHSLKIFLTALAIIDDLGAIMIIALFYSKNFSLAYFGLAGLIFGIMIILNRIKFHQVWLFLILGCMMWFCMHRSGIHATITGVLLAFAIPFGNGSDTSPANRLQLSLHYPVAFLVLPIFALANTAIRIPASVVSDLTSSNSYGIILGLLLGKPLGIFLFAILGTMLSICALPDDIKKQHLIYTGFLAGIGFTMSIFITLLAFSDPTTVDSSKLAVIIGSLLAGAIGYTGLKLTLKNSGL